MNLDEAITQAEEAAARSEADNGPSDDDTVGYRQLAARLKELKEYRARYGKGITQDEMDEALAANEAINFDGFEDAVVGVVERFSSGPLILYNRARCIEILREQSEMNHGEAEEFFEFNSIGCWAGDGTPCFHLPRSQGTLMDTVTIIFLLVVQLWILGPYLAAWLLRPLIKDVEGLRTPPSE